MIPNNYEITPDLEIVNHTLEWMGSPWSLDLARDGNQEAIKFVSDRYIEKYSKLEKSNELF